MKARDQGKNSEVIRQQNRLSVLRVVRDKRIISRVDIAHITGLKQATITNIINELKERDYVKEAGLIEGNNGRRVKGIMLNDEKMRILVSRITSDYYAIGIYDLYGVCIKVEKHFWEKEENFLEKLDSIKEDMKRYAGIYGREKQIIGIGIVIDGSISNMDQSFSSLQKTDIESYLEQYFYVQLEIPVFVENMSNMAAFFEWNRLISAQNNVHTLVCLSISYSIDCAVIFDGKFFRGRNGKIGHFGHVSIDMNGPLCECGNRGCIKKYISVDAIKKKCMELKKKYPRIPLDEECNIREIVQAYNRGEQYAEELYEEVADKLSIILVNLINFFNPDEVIFGDEIPNTDKFLELTKSYIRKRMPEQRYKRVAVKVFREERKTEKDVGMRGMCLFVTNEQLKKMELN